MAGADLLAYVQAGQEDAEFADECWAEAEALVTRHVGKNEVPESVLKRATLEVGSELFHRRSAPNGVAQFETFDAPPVRVARDPMVGAYPILAPFLPLGFA